MMKLYCLFSEVDEGYPVLKAIYQDGSLARVHLEMDLKLGRQWSEDNQAHNKKMYEAGGFCHGDGSMNYSKWNVWRRENPAPIPPPGYEGLVDLVEWETDD